MDSGTGHQSSRATVQTPDSVEAFCAGGNRARRGYISYQTTSQHFADSGQLLVFLLSNQALRVELNKNNCYCGRLTPKLRWTETETTNKEFRYRCCIKPLSAESSWERGMCFIKSRGFLQFLVFLSVRGEGRLFLTHHIPRRQGGFSEQLHLVRVYQWAVSKRREKNEDITNVFLPANFKISNN